METILIVDDEIEIIELLKLYLSNCNYGIVEAYDGVAAYELFQNKKIDLILLDIMMPGTDGISLIKKIRKESNIPIILVSAKGDDLDKINGLGIGADDYISKPFNPLEVVARVQSLLRRSYNSKSLNDSSEKSTDTITIGEISINKVTCEVTKNNQLIKLTSKEFNLLLLLMSHPKRVFTKQQLYEAVWEDAYICDDNIIMVYISRLREKLEDDIKALKYIKTIRSLGYYFYKG